MKQLISLLLALLLLVGCSGGSNEPNNTGSSETEMKSVGILQLLTHDALDKSREGFIDALKDGGWVEGENLTIDYQNPEADQSNLTTMAESLMQADHDVILAIATQPTQSLQAINEDTPILATAVTDFVESGLVPDVSGGNLIAGVSDGCPMDAQLDLLLELNPDVKTIGIIYTSSEQNSEIQADQMQAECDARGIEVVIRTVSDKTMIDDTLQAFNGEIDALYIPTDNNIASAMASVDIWSQEQGVIVLAGESNMCSNGALLSLGVDYYEIGYQTGKMAVEILNGTKTIQDFGVETQEELTVYYNSRTATNLGITIPDSILERGIDVGE